MKYFAQLSLEELWARTLQEIDFLHDEAQRNNAEMSATDLNTLSKALSTLRRHGPLSDPAAGEIGRIEDLLLDAITRETLGFRNVFDGTNDPDHGAIGRVLAVPVLSKNGAALDALGQRFRKILAMRDLLAARVDAGCQMARLEAAENNIASDERAAGSPVPPRRRASAAGLAQSRPKNHASGRFFLLVREERPIFSIPAPKTSLGHQRKGRSTTYRISRDRP